jgi:hypothetical protein
VKLYLTVEKIAWDPSNDTIVRVTFDKEVLATGLNENGYNETVPGFELASMLTKLAGFNGQLVLDIPGRALDLAIPQSGAT